MKPDKLLERLRRGSLQNISFLDVVTLMKTLGFNEQRSKGSHHLFVHPQVNEFMNVQSIKGRVKPYQARQLLRLVDQYNLEIEARDE